MSKRLSHSIPGRAFIGAKIGWLVALTFLFVAAPAPAASLTEVQITDVTPTSFSVVYRDSEPVSVTIDLFNDVLGASAATGITIENPYIVSGNAAIAATLQGDGLARLRIVGLQPNTAYFYRLSIVPALGGPAVLLPANGPYPSVRTMQRTQPPNNPLIGARVTDDLDQPATGTILVVHLAGSPHPVTHIVGDNYSDGFAAIQSSNLYDPISGENISVSDGVQLEVVAEAGLSGQALIDVTLAAGENVGQTWVPGASPLVLLSFADADNDGMPDDFERRYGLDPAVDDSGGDLDSDGLTNLEEFLQGTDPTNDDTDGDGLTDGDEVNSFGTLATQADSDQDGLSDDEEIGSTGTDPLDSDSDGDGASDGEEIGLGTDPNDDTSTPVFDEDLDGIADDVDNCPVRPNAAQIDTDGDGDGNACDDDDDGDGIPDATDNAPLDQNPAQADDDQDGVGNAGDNCPAIFNPDQVNNDADADGDACDDDDDNDGVLDFGTGVSPSDTARSIVSLSEIVSSSIPIQANADATIWIYKFDLDNDVAIPFGQYNLTSLQWLPEPLTDAEITVRGFLALAQSGCACAVFGPGTNIVVRTEVGDLQIAMPQSSDMPPFALRFVSEDGSSYTSRFLSTTRLTNIVADSNTPPSLDNCRVMPNPSQLDSDGDGIGDACDNTADDVDGDGVDNEVDNCPVTNNPNQSDVDNDGDGDLCDADADNDGIDNQVEIDLLGTSPFAADSNFNGISDADEDFDFDGIRNADELARGLSPDMPDSSLKPGLNLVYFPIEIPPNYTSFDLLTELGGEGSVERVEQVATSTEEVLASFYDTGIPAGDEFDIIQGNAYMVTMLVERTQTWPGRPLCRTVDLLEGKHLLGFGCVPRGMTASQLLDSLGATSIESLQSFDATTGRFTTAGFDQGVVVGEDYLLTGVDGYIAHLRATTSTEIFNLAGPSVAFENIIDGQIVSDDEILIEGLLDDPNAQVSINGVAVPLVVDGEIQRFSLSVQLTEGANTIVVRVRGANNQLVERIFTINYLPPPELELISHFDGQETPSSRTTILGSVSSDAVAVDVNGSAATIANGEFRLDGFPLQEGQNEISVTAIGANGATQTTTVIVTSVRIFNILRTVPPGTLQDSITAQFELRLPPSVFSEVSFTSSSLLQTTGANTSSVTNPSGGVQFPPDVFQLTYTTRVVTPHVSLPPIGETERIFEIRFLDALGQVIWVEEVTFRIAVVDDQDMLLFFDEEYDARVVEDGIFTITGRVVGRVDSVTVNGLEATIGAAGIAFGNIPFSIDVPLQPGENYLDVLATNSEGSSGREFLIDWTDDDALDVLITSHRSKSVVSGTNIDVSGSVTIGTASVSVNGVGAVVTELADGSGIFSATIPLVPGVNDVRAVANVGSLEAGSALRLIQGPFDLTVTSIEDRGISRSRRMQVEGVASTDLQTIVFFGQTVAVSGTEFSFFTTRNLLENISNRVVLEATSVAGDTVEIEMFLRYEPLQFSVLNPVRTRIEIQIEVAEADVPNIVDWHIPQLSDNRPPGLNSRPTEGLYSVVPGVTSLGNGLLSLQMDIELHGNDLFQTPDDVITIDFLDASGGVVASKRVDWSWTFTTVVEPSLFFTSISDGYVLDHSPIEVFGQLEDIVDPTSLTVNGLDVLVGDDWRIPVPLVEGENTIDATLVYDGGQTITESINVILAPPRRVDLFEGGPDVRPMLFHMVLAPRNTIYSQRLTGDPLWFNYTSPDSVSTRTNGAYERASEFPDYFISEFTPTFSADAATDAEDYGIWEFGLEVRGDFPSPSRTRTYLFWLNLVEPSLATGPGIREVSHVNIDVVDTETVTYTVDVFNDPFARIEINSVSVPPTHTRRPIEGPRNRLRIDVEYTTQLTLVPGDNAITVRAISDNGTESTFVFSLNYTP